MKLSVRVLLMLVALRLAGCGDGAGANSSPVAVVPPRVALDKVDGTYVGSMLTEGGVEAVVLKIGGIETAGKGFIFRYRLNVPGVIEDGVGALKVEGAATRVCFEAGVCGWLIAEKDSLRIDAALRSGELLPAWSLKKL